MSGLLTTLWAKTSWWEQTANRCLSLEEPDYFLQNELVLKHETYINEQVPWWTMFVTNKLDLLISEKSSLLRILQ